MVVVVLLLLVDDLQLEEELLLIEEFGVGGVQQRWRLTLGFLVWRNILVILQLLHLWFVISHLLRALNRALTTHFTTLKETERH